MAVAEPNGSNSILYKKIKNEKLQFQMNLSKLIVSLFLLLFFILAFLKMNGKAIIS